MEQLTLLSAEALVKISPSQETEQEFMENVLDWQGSILELLQKYSPNGLSGKTYRVSLRQTADEILQKLPMKWQNSGMGSHGECWTHNTLEFPKDDAESSLSDILETGDHLQPFFLSQRACRGILKRANKKNKKLPKLIEEILIRQC